MISILPDIAIRIYSTISLLPSHFRGEVRTNTNVAVDRKSRYFISTLRKLASIWVYFNLIHTIVSLICMNAACMQQLHTLNFYVHYFRCHRYWSYCSYFCNNRSDRCRGNLFSMYVFTFTYQDGMIVIYNYTDSLHVNKFHDSVY